MGVDYLVLGGAGMLGHKVLQHLYESGDNVGCTLRRRRDDSGPGADLFASVDAVLEDFDVTDPQRAIDRIAAMRPRVVINAIGIVKQRPAAADFVQSIAVNALWPHLLSAAALSWGGRVIHFSTDCVFSGIQGDYKENDEPDAQDLYGRTKLLGELLAPNCLTIRTSMIGRELHHFTSLLEWFVAQRGSQVRGFTRVWFSGVATNYLAFVVRKLIFEYPTLSGLYHLAGPKISKHDLLCVINEKLELDIEIIPDDTLFCDRSLDGSRFLTITGLVTPSWNEMVSDIARDPQPLPQ